MKIKLSLNKEKWLMSKKSKENWVKRKKSQIKKTEEVKVKEN